MTPSDRDELLELTGQLLNCIATQDWQTYERLCDASLTAFEPEARGHLVEGLAFHKFYFDLGPHDRVQNTSIVAPHVRLIGNDVGVVSYIRLVQCVDASGRPETMRFEETRLWQRHQGEWRHVHFHRSQNG